MRSAGSSSEHSETFKQGSSDSDAYVPIDDPDGEFQGNYKNSSSKNNTMPLRHSERNVGHSISYNEIEDEYDKDSEEDLDPILGNGRIDHIYFSRKSHGILEYLVDFHEAPDSFAHWFSADQLLLQSTNFKRSLQKFNETPMKIQCYNISQQNKIFNSTYLSPLHIISHRPLNNDPDSNSLEFLCQFDLETGNPYVWEPNSSDAPQKLIKEYMNTRVSVLNGRPERPKNLDIPYETKSEYKSKDGFEPKDYQIDGVNWMLRCFCSNHGCILADEMGLGKTIQCLVFLTRLNRASDFHGPFLIAVRTNTFTQWCSEIERWCDLKYIAYNGSRENREMIRKYQMPFFDDSGQEIEGRYNFNVLLVTYEIFLKDVEYLKKVDWQVLMLDEGHRIKNVDGKKHNALESIPSMHRIILTGTPIQSTLLELWTLLNFVSPDFFVDNQMFPEDDVESLDDDVLSELRNLITPHLMRRSLIDVEHSIIPKDEKVVFLQLTQQQKELTRLVKMHELYRILDGAVDNHNDPNLLHRICNHPFLIEGTRQYFEKKYKLKKVQLLTRFSAKFMFLNKILPVFKKQGRSVLIFSQRLKILKLLSEYCTYKNYNHEMLIGSLSETEKKEAISRFSDENKDVFIFLISTRSGSEGLNLTKASITIIFDPDWNPQNDLQAQGRCHRIGQTQKVDVIRLLTYGTYEHEMFSRAQRKLKLWDILLGEGKTTDPSLAKKAELPTNNDDHLNNNNYNGNLMGNSFHHDLIELEGVISEDAVKETTKEIIEEVANSTEFEPPPLMKDSSEANLSYEEILEKTSTVVNDIQLIAQQSRHFPELDLSFGGMSDEDFLKQFDVDSDSASGLDKKRNRINDNVQRVQLDPKSAKRLIKFLEIHGYGQWELIHQSIQEICPIEQVIRFCQGAIILHFRAINWTLISSFPLLLKQLENDVPKFDLSLVMNNEKEEWYSVFSKRAIFYGESTNTCKQIANHIHKTALPFLAHLEHHLLVSEWRKGKDEFPFDLLPIVNDRDIKQDVELYEGLISGKPLSTNADDQTRTAQIFTMMKTQLLLRKDPPVDAFIIPFWTKGEVSTLFSLFRNFGDTVLGFKPELLRGKSTLMSKDPDEIMRFSSRVIKILAGRLPSNRQPLFVPDDLSLINQNVPDESFSEQIVIELPEVLATIKRILLIKLVHEAIANISSKRLDMSKVLSHGEGWFSIQHCLDLLKLLAERGMDDFTGILLSAKYPFKQHLTPDDEKYLESFNKNDLKEDTKLPSFLTNENKFYAFLKVLSGRAKNQNSTNSHNNNSQPAIPQSRPQKPPNNGMQVPNQQANFANVNRADVIRSVYAFNYNNNTAQTNINSKIVINSQMRGNFDFPKPKINTSDALLQRQVHLMRKQNRH